MKNDTTSTVPQRKTHFPAIYTGSGPDEGKTFRWSFYRCPVHRLWILVDYEGYERALEKTWAESVPRIQLIVENHGMTCKIS